jgi:hypothetical protein
MPDTSTARTVLSGAPTPPRTAQQRWWRGWLVTAHRRPGDDARDHGFALLESLFVIPLVFTIILSAVQLGEWWYARQLALSAAQEGARTARAYDGTDAAGATSASGYLTQIDGPGGRILLDPTVTVQRSPTLITVTVQGRVPAILPFLPSTVNEQSSGVPETFVPG